MDAQTLGLIAILAFVIIFTRRTKHSEPALDADGKNKKCPLCKANITLVTHGRRQSENCSAGCGYTLHLRA